MIVGVPLEDIAECLETRVDRLPHQGGHVGGGERFVLLLPGAEEVGVENDVGVENLTGEGIHAGRSHREAGVGGDPAEEVVTDVFGIDVVVIALVADLDGG
ncbi:MAG: hypothetical protein NT069_10105, partial [Planctomycetota bacterium]|nr:hypothetical protein [Planctomycetota bacterium]